MYFKCINPYRIIGNRYFTLLNMNKRGNYEVNLLNIPSNVSENDTVTWLKSIDVESCHIIEKDEKTTERTAIIEVTSLDMCEKLYQRSGKMFFKNQVEVIPTFPSSIQPFYIHKIANFNLKNWLKPLECIHTRLNYLIPKYIQLFLDLNDWPTIIKHNGKYGIKIFKKMKIESLNKLAINNIPLSVTLKQLNSIFIPYGAKIDNLQKNLDESTFTGIIYFDKNSVKEDFFIRRRFIEFDDGYATLEPLDELYFIPLDSPLIIKKSRE